MAGRAAPGVPGGTSTSADLRTLVAALVDDRDWMASTTAEVNEAIRSELPELGTSDEMRAAHAREFVARELGPLAADDDSALRLAGTLRVYLEESSSPRRTAERLGVHANTIANRVRAIEEQLGHPVESRIAELLVALRLAPLVRDASD